MAFPAANGPHLRPNDREFPAKRSTRRLGTPRSTAAAPAASSGTACSSRNGATQRTSPTSSRRPKAALAPLPLASPSIAVWSNSMTSRRSTTRRSAPRSRRTKRTGPPATPTPHPAPRTAGFDDGRPPKLVYRPGTSGIYSNDTSNMLAELLTLRFGEDLNTVLKREVLDPIGMRANEWTWRANQFRAKTVGDLPSREFASGIPITHPALARLGLLYLHEGEWNGKRVP